MYEEIIYFKKRNGDKLSIPVFLSCEECGVKTESLINEANTALVIQYNNSVQRTLLILHFIFMLYFHETIQVKFGSILFLYTE